MIAAIQLNNQEIHKDSKIIFSEKSNLIIGTSDHGKSAIRRALQFAVFSRPVSGNFTDDAAKGFAKVIFKDKGKGFRFIERGRKDGENYYKLSGVNEALTGFNKAVPVEVSEIARLKEDNIQEQSDQHYILDRARFSPGKLAKKFHDILGLSLIDESNAAAKDIVNTISTEIRVLDKDIEADEKALTKLHFVDEAEEKLKDIQKLFKKYTELEQTIASHTYIAQQLNDVEHRIHEIHIPSKDKIENIRSFKQRLMNKDAAIKGLRIEEANLNGLKTRLLWIDKKEAEKPKIKKAVDLSVKIQQKAKLMKKEEQDIYTLSAYLSSATAVMREITALRRDRELLLREKKELEKDISVCPLCGGPYRK
jgi:exonuclease SbcC